MIDGFALCWPRARRACSPAGHPSHLKGGAPTPTHRTGSFLNKNRHLRHLSLFSFQSDESSWRNLSPLCRPAGSCARRQVSLCSRQASSVRGGDCISLYPNSSFEFGHTESRWELATGERQRSSGRNQLQASSPFFTHTWSAPIRSKAKLPNRSTSAKWAHYRRRRRRSSKTFLAEATCCFRRSSSASAPALLLATFDIQITHSSSSFAAPNFKLIFATCFAAREAKKMPAKRRRLFQLVRQCFSLCLSPTARQRKENDQTLDWPAEQAR